MLGAIIGDIVGSTYEFNNTRDYNFELFPEGSSYTDDTICTIAIADAILKGIPYKDSLLDWCRRYRNPMGAYGNMFAQWIDADDPKPYNSFGNGAAMRVSPIGWAFPNPKEAIDEARRSAECSHNHPEGIKGAEAIAAITTYLATHHNTDYSRQMVLMLAVNFYGVNFRNNVPAPGIWDGTCQGCVPLAIKLYLESKTFDDAIRLAISYGGDSDTLGCIVGTLAGAAYGITASLREKALSYLPTEMKEVIFAFENKYCKTKV